MVNDQFSVCITVVGMATTTTSVSFKQFSDDGGKVGSPNILFFLIFLVS